MHNNNFHKICVIKYKTVSGDRTTNIPSAKKMNLDEIFILFILLQPYSLVMMMRMRIRHVFFLEFFLNLAEYLEIWRYNCIKIFRNIQIWTNGRYVTPCLLVGSGRVYIFRFLRYFCCFSSSSDLCTQMFLRFSPLGKCDIYDLIENSIW